MQKKTVTLDCGLRQLMHARDALGALSGVIGTQVITGKSALRVWQGDELSEEALTGALRGCGLSDHQFHIQ